MKMPTPSRLLSVVLLLLFSSAQWIPGSHRLDRPFFEEIPASQSGLRWVHDNAMSEDRHLPETTGPGCAFLDYNNDGWMDIYLVNYGTCDFYRPAQPPSNALYRNNRDGTFTDVTAQAGVSGGNFGMGAAVGDYDNDGDPDIYVSAYGKAILYRNQGNGTFQDVTAAAGVAAPGWTTSAVWFDFDNDTDLDLFVCSYVEYGLDNPISCGINPLGKTHYCPPRVFRPTPSLLFRNNGDGSFTEVSQETAIARVRGKALGVVATDVNNDRLMDLFVANDMVQNFLLINRGDNQWEEAGLLAEVAFSSAGKPRSGMGVDAADFNGDGWQDLFVANLDQEMSALYQNYKDETFRDVSQAHGVAQATFQLSGWGLKFLDFDNNGTVDLFLAHGHPDDMIHSYSNRVIYKMPLLLFSNDGTRLHNVSLESGPLFDKMFPARGLAVGDYQNDGRVDILIANNGQQAMLLQNNGAEGNHWLGLKLEGRSCNRDAVGARIRWSIDGKAHALIKNNGASYLASHDPRVLMGLGSSEKIDWLEIEWPAPSQRVDRFEAPAIDRYLTIVEGEGVR